MNREISCLVESHREKIRQYNAYILSVFFSALSDSVPSSMCAMKMLANAIATLVPVTLTQ